MQFVLIVEPCPELRELLDIQLRLEGYRTHTVASAEDALDCLSSTHVALITTEVRFSGMSGTIFLLQLKQRGYTTPILAISTEPSPPPEFDTYLQKPYHLADLHKMVQTLLEGTVNYATSPHSLSRASLPELSATPRAANR